MKYKVCQSYTKFVTSFDLVTRSRRNKFINHCLLYKRLLRGTIIRLACGHEYKPCLDAAKDKFTQWLSDPENNR